MHRRGFTLIELLITVAIVAILAYLVTVATYHLKEKSKLARVTVELTDISKAVTEYAEDNNYQYPPDASRAVPPGLEKYLAGGVWPASVWPHGVFDWDNWSPADQGVPAQIYQINYRLCDLGDPASYCSDPDLFPTFNSHSGIFYCISGPCIPHPDEPTAPAYCVNCTPKKRNY